MRNIVKTIAAFLLILLFTYAAFSKLIPLEGFRVQLYKQPFPHWLSDILLYVLPAIELLTAALLASGRTMRLGLLFSSVMLLSFSAYIILAMLHYWTKVPCPCGGILTHMPWSVHLALNLGLAAVTLAALLIKSAPKPN